MEVFDPLPRLEELLLERGVVLEDGPGTGPPRVGAGVDARTAWEVFRDTAREPSGLPAEDCDDDMLLFEGYWGSALPARGLGWAPEGTEPAAFLLRFSRTVTVYDEFGDSDGRQTLCLRIECSGDRGTLSASDECFGYAGPIRPDVSDETHPEIKQWAGHVDNWAARVESSSSFAALDVLHPSSFLLYDDD